MMLVMQEMTLLGFLLSNLKFKTTSISHSSATATAPGLSSRVFIAVLALFKLFYHCHDMSVSFDAFPVSALSQILCSCCSHLNCLPFYGHDEASKGIYCLELLFNLGDIDCRVFIRRQRLLSALVNGAVGTFVFSPPHA